MFNQALSDERSSVRVIPLVAEQKAVVISFEELYKQHCRRIYSICLKMLANTADAEDLNRST